MTRRFPPFLVFVSTLLLLGCGARSDDGDPTGSAHIYKSIIVGAGMAGLSTAYELRNHDILVLEKEGRVGGRVWEGEHRGFSYAKGAVYIGEPEGLMRRIIKNYGLETVELMYPSNCHYNPNVPGYEDTGIYNGWDGIAFMHYAEDGANEAALSTFNRYITEPSDLVDQFYAAGGHPPFFDTSHPMSELDNKTMRQWLIENNFGLSYQDKWNSHARGLYGANIDEISMLMAISEFGWENYGEAPLDEAPVESWNDYQTDVYSEETFSFLGGMSEIPQAIANDMGERLILNATVFEVTLSDDVYTVSFRDESQNIVVRRANSVVLAVPAPVALQVAPTLITGEKRTIMEGIDYAQYLTVNIFSNEPIQNFTFDISLGGDTFVNDFYDSQWVQRWEEQDNPLNDEVFITTAYMGGRSYTENLVDMTDEAIIAEVFADMESVFPGSSDLVADYEINRFTYGYPVFGLGAFAKIQRLNELNAQEPRTFILTGDYMALPTTEAASIHAEYAADILSLGQPHSAP